MHNHIKTNDGANNNPKPEYNIVREYYTLANAVYQSLPQLLNTDKSVDNYHDLWFSNNNFYYYNLHPIMNAMDENQKKLIDKVHIKIKDILAMYRPAPPPLPKQNNRPH